MKFNIVYLSLGSNLGDKINNLQNAINLIDSKVGDVLLISSLYKTKADGFVGEDFLNCCLSLRTSMEPKILIKELINIESKNGRLRSNRNIYESRSIDIDILFYEDKIINQNNLTIPHPRMHKRNFVIKPLLEIAKSKIHPVLNQTTFEIDLNLSGTGIFKINDTLTLPIFEKLKSIKNIVVEGNIGVGKTCLSEKLSKDLNKELILEGYMDNPFLEKYYENPDRYALNVELTFLIDRCRQLNDFNNQISLFNSGLVADYDIFKSLVFAGISLKEIEYNLFRRIFIYMTKDLFKSNLIIYLLQSTEQLLENIKKRGRGFEKKIDKKYLDKVNKGYLNYLKNNSDLNIIFIDVSDLDFVESKTDYIELLYRIKKNLR
ncbi:MAG: 2-amino-4-hydroxy-6-hydroxymethyldihydropteridine diphosphokinase [Flavobacteriaceae bacterium]|nr:2-amino-4-hydroxy-6-hydroxymethyldihydropteridine diphosphokinase [Flavobacteriaceae bacterium]